MGKLGLESGAGWALTGTASVTQLAGVDSSWGMSGGSGAEATNEVQSKLQETL